MRYKSKFFLVFALVATLAILLSACSTSESPAATREVGERTTGYSSQDGTLVGPRSTADENGIPLNVGAYGKRKKHEGDLTIDENGTTIRDIDVEGVIYIKADNVTVANFTATRVTQDPQYKGMTLEDGTIRGNNSSDDGIQWSNFTAVRMDISGTFDGIKAQGNTVIQDSYIHDMYAWRGPDAGEGGYTHNDCIQVSIGKNVLIERNWMDNCGFNSAIFIAPDQGPVENVTVRYNYMNGGGITFYAIASRSATFGIPKNITVTQNVFGNTHEFDYATIGQGISFTHNITVDRTEVIPRSDDDTT